jgi:tautomerase-like protein
MRKTAFPELSTPQALSLDTQKTTFSNASFRWTQATSESTRTTLALPKPRTDQMLMIEVLVSSGTDTDRKRGLVAALVEKLGEASVDPNNIMVFFLEVDRTSGSFGGGQFAPPVAFA